MNNAAVTLSEVVPSRVAIVGGLERNETEYRDVAERLGVEVVFHSGHVRGRGSAALVELVRRSDVILVLTDVNSHGAVWLARQSARRFGRRIELHRRLSPARLAARLGANAPATEL